MAQIITLIDVILVLLQARHRITNKLSGRVSRRRALVKCGTAECGIGLWSSFMVGAIDGVKSYILFRSIVLRSFSTISRIPHCADAEWQ